MSYKHEYDLFGFIETEDKAVCPYCYAERDFDHDDYGELEDCHLEEECGECGKTYKVKQYTKIEFWADTRKLEVEE